MSLDSKVYTILLLLAVGGWESQGGASAGNGNDVGKNEKGDGDAKGVNKTKPEVAEEERANEEKVEFRK
jgi:hypothetical protein